MRPSHALLLSSLLFSASAHADELRERANAVFKPIPAKVTEVRGKSVSENQALLGHKLWFDPRLSSSHIISCNSCHNLSIGGSDNVPTSIGHGWQKGPRNSPTVLNAVFNAAQFWDGRAQDLQEQAKGPVQASVEMNSTPERASPRSRASRSMSPSSARPSPTTKTRSASTTWPTRWRPSRSA